MRVEVVDYNPAWVTAFRQEAHRLRAVFGEGLVAIHHIGSTSVPGLSAKPVIDIMPVVRDIARVDTFNSQMQAIGYECMGEFGIPGRRYFRRGGDVRTHHVHVFAAGDSNVNRHLVFRDYLRLHSEDAARYAALKSKLAQKFPHDIDGYVDGKDALVKEIEAKASAWQAATADSSSKSQLH